MNKRDPRANSASVAMGFVTGMLTGMARGGRDPAPLLAAVGITSSNLDDPQGQRIGRVATRADQRGRGLAGQLMEWAHSHIGFHTTVLDVGLVRDTLNVLLKFEADIEAAKRVLASSAEMLRADPGCGPRVLGPAEIAGVDRWDGDAAVIRARVPVAPSAQATIRREWLARVKDGLDHAGVHSPTQRIRLLADPMQRNK